RGGLRAARCACNCRRMERPFILFDDARDGAGAARLYRDLVGEIRASAQAQVLPALEEVRSAVAAGKHAAGYLAYEAGFAFDPALADYARAIGGPLLWFGVFDGFEEVDAASWLPDPAGARLGSPQPRVARDAYLAAVRQVREHLFAGDFYQANLTFGNDAPVHGNPLAAYARLRASAKAGWGGVVRHP